MLINAEDLIYLKNEFPNMHRNPFTVITKADFDNRMNKLIENVNKYSNAKILTELSEIFAAIKDSHSGINVYDGNVYPISVFAFSEGIYITDVEISLAELLHSKIIKINNICINEIIAKLKKLIPYENENWALYMLPRYICHAIFMYGLGIITDYQKTVFTIEKDGKMRDVVIPMMDTSKGQSIGMLIQKHDNVIYRDVKRAYEYEYLEEAQALLFIYNSCTSMSELPFERFVINMFEYIKGRNVKKIVIDLRHNTGGNSNVILPFLTGLAVYLQCVTHVDVYLLVGRRTFSSGMFAIYQIMDTIPHTISVGESTGGALDRFGEVGQFNLPNSQLSVRYSKKYFEFSTMFKYKNHGGNTFIPQVIVPLLFTDYVQKKDATLSYALNN